MKDISEVECCVMDAGTFVPLAETMSHVCKKVSYYSPFEQEYLGIERCCIGDGMPTYDRVDEYMDPDFFNRQDLWIFPDIGYGGFQRYLRSIGKAVWGSMGASDLELFRTYFIDTLDKVGLTVIPTVTVVGVTALGEHLKSVEDKWVKINRYRDNMETWHHYNYTQSQRELERLAWKFGPLKEYVTFVVQDCVKGDHDEPVIEIGYDGWCITRPDKSVGFPSKSYQGYELKNKLYLGSELAAEDLPEEITTVNEAMAPVLAKYGYRNFWATEIRKKGDVVGFIDPTARMAGQTMEHLLETCTNLAEVIWSGSNGEIIEPDFTNQFSAEATLHYTADNEGWKTFKVPKKVEREVKLYRCCFQDGAYHFPPHKSDELGVILGAGDTIEESVDNLKENFEELKGEPVDIDLSGFADLLKQIKEAEESGVEFSDQEVPNPEIVLND